MGRVWKYGDDINTDVIFPGRYLHIVDAAEMAKHAMEDLDAEFAKNVKPGDIIVAGKNFGCGSSREQAAIAIKHAGVRAVVAQSFARIFYRNAINQGLPALVTQNTDKFDHGDIVEVNLAAGVIHNKTKNIDVEFEPLPSFLMQIIDDGGLIPHLRKKLKTEQP